MIAVNYSTIRKNLKEYCDKATDNYETVIVTRKEEKNVVIMSLEKYNSLVTAAQNAEYLDKIDRSVQQISEGKVVTKTMEELESMTNEYSYIFRKRLGRLSLLASYRKKYLSKN